MIADRDAVPTGGEGPTADPQEDFGRGPQEGRRRGTENVSG